MKQLIRLIIPAFLFLYVSLPAFADVKLPAVFADHMVLQQRSDAPVWGWAAPGEAVSVKGSWMNKPVHTTAGNDGKWKVKINTPAAGGPYTLTVSGANTITLRDVLIGEVWICSGQSNMEMPVKGWAGAPIANSAQEISQAHYPKIRLFTVKKEIALRPEDDCTGNWAACSPETVGDFSATAYFFGRELYKKLGVPIGLIHTSWGGTPAEAWTSRNALRKLGDFNDYLAKLDSLGPHVDRIREEYAQKLAAWKTSAENINEDYAQQGLQDNNWKTMELPAAWESAGLPGYDGIVWFRKEVTIPASWAGKPLKLDLGPIDDMDITWFNGKKVGAIQEEGQWTTKRSYDIPAGLVKAGSNTIAVRVTDMRGGGGIYGEKASLRLYPAGAPAQDISLAGNWRYKATSAIPQPAISYDANSPTVLYNGMIAPLVPFAIRGAIWYQGEANVGRAEQYARLFPAMIRNWRDKWDEGQFPFYFVQIAPYKYGGDGMSSAALRDAQRLSLATPNTGMVVTLDIGNNTNIHPANKQEVGRRLALWALADTYGKKGTVYSGPLYRDMEVKGNSIVLSFDHTDGGLTAKGGTLTGFEAAGQDGRFSPATAVIRGNTVVVHADAVSHPVAVRYDWKDTADPRLFNKAGLPASSFRAKE